MTCQQRPLWVGPPRHRCWRGSYHHYPHRSCSRPRGCDRLPHSSDLHSHSAPCTLRSKEPLTTGEARHSLLLNPDIPRLIDPRPYRNGCCHGPLLPFNHPTTDIAALAEDPKKHEEWSRHGMSQAALPDGWSAHPAHTSLTDASQHACRHCGFANLRTRKGGSNTTLSDRLRQTAFTTLMINALHIHNERKEY